MLTDEFRKLSPMSLSDVMTKNEVMNFMIRPLWNGIPRIAGPAFTVRCDQGDNVMLHAAIYRAPAGSVIVVEAGDTDFAVAGGNVCAVAQKRGIAGFIIDGVIRDLAEIRELKFPVFARGVSPIPGTKEKVTPLNIPIKCGGIPVHSGDIIVADEEGIVVVPQARIEPILKAAQIRAAKDAATTLDEWQKSHQAKIEEILQSKEEGKR
jgi:4-hydroxy-4-methyl-2-oxoglutarate aldolase